MKFSLKSVGSFELSGRGTVFVVESPVPADRNFKGILEAIGGTVEIDGITYEALAFETFCLGSPVREGERIGILVRGHEDEAQG